MLPTSADELVSYRWPDALDLESVRHSEDCYTVTLMDLDYLHYTFRLNRGLNGRWTLIPIAGFSYSSRSDSDLEEDGWQSAEPTEPTAGESTIT